MDINNSYCFSKKTIIYEKKKHWLKNQLLLVPMPRLSAVSQLAGMPSSDPGRL